MLKKVFVILFLVFICSHLSISFIEADELKISSDNNNNKKYKYNLSICAIFKNEAHYLKEWIEYHRIFGVDHFYLYNIGSRDFYQAVLMPYIEKGIVTLINWPEAISYQGDNYAYKWALSTQIPAYENAVNFVARDQTKWLVVVDIDEYLVCPKENIVDLLKQYDDYPGISLSSDFFDAAIYDKIPQRKLLIQSLNLASPPKQIIDEAVAKMIFKPNLCQGFIWPPYQCRFKYPQSSIAVNRQELRINHYINRNMEYSSFMKKAGYKLNVDNRILSEKEITVLLKAGYMIEDQDRPIYQHIPELLKRMGQK